MATVMVRDLNVLAVYVSDLARSEAFYRDQLGFEKMGDMEPGVLMKAGNVTLYIEACRLNGRGGLSDNSEFSPCFGTDSVKASYEALRNAGVLVNSEYREYGPTFALFRICDPDGNLIEFAGTP